MKIVVEIFKDGTILCDGISCTGTHRCPGCPLEEITKKDKPDSPPALPGIPLPFKEGAVTSEV